MITKKKFNLNSYVMKTIIRFEKHHAGCLMPPLLTNFFIHIKNEKSKQFQVSKLC
jgi:hypothetical protein